MKKGFLTLFILVLLFITIPLTRTVISQNSTPLLEVGFESDEEIAAKGGSFSLIGDHQYVEGVIGSGIQLNSQSIRFPLSGNFNSRAGTIEFYVKANPDPAFVRGGYFDIGTVGSANSIV